MNRGSLALTVGLQVAVFLQGGRAVQPIIEGRLDAGERAAHLWCVIADGRGRKHQRGSLDSQMIAARRIIGEFRRRFGIRRKGVVGHQVFSFAQQAAEEIVLNLLLRARALPNAHLFHFALEEFAERGSCFEGTERELIGRAQRMCCYAAGSFELAVDVQLKLRALRIRTLAPGCAVDRGVILSFAIEGALATAFVEPPPCDQPFFVVCSVA